MEWRKVKGGEYTQEVIAIWGGEISGGNYTSTIYVNGGEIINGNYTVDVYVSGGKIHGGSYTRRVDVEEGEIINGNYTGPVLVHGRGKLNGGSYAGRVEVSDGGEISGGTYTGQVDVTSLGRISGGTFECVVNITTDYSEVTGGTFLQGITGNLNDIVWGLTMNRNGSSLGNTTEMKPAGTAVSIDAGEKEGYTFSHWSSEGGGSFADASAASTTFTMPENPVTITANWIANDSGNGGNGNSGSSGNAGSTDYSDQTSDQTAGRSSSTGEDLDEASSDRSTDLSTSVTSGAQAPATDPMMVLVEATTEKLQKAKAGSTLVLDNKNWNSYSLYFMQELQKRRDLTVVIKYIYKNENYTVTIPAGQEIKLDEEILWYGPLKLASMFETEVTK